MSCITYHSPKSISFTYKNNIQYPHFPHIYRIIPILFSPRNEDRYPNKSYFLILFIFFKLFFFSSPHITLPHRIQLHHHSNKKFPAISNGDINGISAIFSISPEQSIGLSDSIDGRMIDWERLELGVFWGRSQWHHPSTWSQRIPQRIKC